MKTKSKKHIQSMSKHFRNIYNIILGKEMFITNNEFIW